MGCLQPAIALAYPGISSFIWQCNRVAALIRSAQLAVGEFLPLFVSSPGVPTMSAWALSLAVYIFLYLFTSPPLQRRGTAKPQLYQHLFLYLFERDHLHSSTPPPSCTAQLISSFI